MSELYRQMENQKAGNLQLLLCVVEGPHLGAKAFLVNGRMVYSERDPEDVLPKIDVKDLPGKSGLLNFGKDKIYVNYIVDTPKLILCGAGHVGLALIRLMKGLEFEITVVEDREDYAREARNAGADRVLVGNYAEILSQLPSGRDSYFVCMTRGHHYDQLCLGEILKKNCAYVGMMGSRFRSDALRREFLQAGVAQELLERLHAPIGLSIGAQTPEEIAISVAAELIATRRGEADGERMDRRFLHLLAEAEDGKHMLCTIVDKHGSAPRSIGTQMLVGAFGEVYGTIGGGSTEAKILEEARRMLAEGAEHQLMTLSVTTADVVDGGAFCGGEVTVFLERL